MTTGGLDALRAACVVSGLPADGAETIRLGENDIYRLPGRAVGRVARPGQAAVATREVAIGRWLEAAGIPAVEPLDVAQPILVGGRAVTFWQELPPHRPGTPGEVAVALRRLHALSAPEDVPLAALDPFVRVADRIDAAQTLAEGDRAWLRARLADLERRYAALDGTRRPCPVHGDAWAGNVVATSGGEVVFLDLERFSIGPPEWDLVSTAVKRHSLAGITANEYRAFCDAYGIDVTTWAGYELLRDIRELRMTTYVAQLDAGRPGAAVEAVHRVRCLRGDHGPRPWSWTGF